MYDLVTSIDDLRDLLETSEDSVVLVEISKEDHATEEFTDLMNDCDLVAICLLDEETATTVRLHIELVEEN